MNDSFLADNPSGYGRKRANTLLCLNQQAFHSLVPHLAASYEVVLVRVRPARDQFDAVTQTQVQLGTIKIDQRTLRLILFTGVKTRDDV
jgi:hypothetical protein